MRCKKCGAENSPKAKFCSRCGTSLRPKDSADVSLPAETAEQKKEPGRKKRKRWIWIIPAVLLLAAAIGGTAMFILNQNNKERQYDSTVADGNRYLEDLDYEKAEEAFLRAVTIDPKQKEPYLKLIDIYIAQEEYDQAAETAEKARDSVPAEDKQEFEEILENWENITDYTWVVEPEIEADDINYVCGAPFERGENGWTVENDRNGQFTTNYAVVRTGNRTGFIDFSGNISWADDSDYQTQRTENGEYYIDKGLLSGLPREV